MAVETDEPVLVHENRGSVDALGTGIELATLIAAPLEERCEPRWTGR